MRSPTSYIGYRLISSNENTNKTNFLQCLLCLSITINLVIGVAFLSNSFYIIDDPQPPKIVQWYPKSKSVYLQWGNAYYNDKRPLWYQLNYGNQTIKYISGNNFLLNTKTDLTVSISAIWPDQYQLTSTDKSVSIAKNNGNCTDLDASTIAYYKSYYLFGDIIDLCINLPTANCISNQIKLEKKCLSCFDNFIYCVHHFEANYCYQQVEKCTGLPQAFLFKSF